MANVKISQFQRTNIVNDADDLTILQNGINKIVKSPVLESKILEKAKGYIINSGVGFGGFIDLETPSSELENAYFFPTESGIYSNYGNIEVDLSNGFYIIYKKDSIYESFFIPIQLGTEVNTIEDLRLKIGAEGDVITLLGYYEKGDKQPLNYKYTTERGVDDGGSVINTDSGSWIAVFGKYVTPEDFGAVGNGVVNDTINIQKSLDYEKSDGIIFSKEYLIDKIHIDNKDNYKVIGSVINLTTDDLSAKGIELRNVNNLEISSFVINGNASNYLRCRGIYSPSGFNLTNLNIYNNTISNNSIGISCNADLAGKLSNINIYNNNITNILGENAGNGYGIHISHHDYSTLSNVNIYDNNIDNCERHSIYLARGRGYNVYNNYIKNHRKNIYSSVDPRASINISRVCDVNCYENKSVNGNGGSLMITGDVKDVLPIANNINIYNNYLENLNDISTLWVGYLNADLSSLIQNINIFNNTIIYKGSVVQYCLAVRFGKDIYIQGNMFLSSKAGIVLDNLNDNTNLYTDNIHIIDNVFKTDGSCIRFASTATSIVSIFIRDNIYPDNVSVFNSPVNISNPNIFYFNVKNQTLGIFFVSGNSFKQTYIADLTYKGFVNKSVSVSNVATTPPNELSPQTVTTIAEAQVAINNIVSMVNSMRTNELELKTKLNAKLTADRNSGQQAI